MRGRERSLWLFLRIGLLFIGSAHQVIQADMVVVCQFYGKFQGQRALLSFVFGIERLVTQQKVRNFLLCQVVVLPQVTDS